MAVIFTSEQDIIVGPTEKVFVMNEQDISYYEYFKSINYDCDICTVIGSCPRAWNGSGECPEESKEAFMCACTIMTQELAEQHLYVIRP